MDIETGERVEGELDAFIAKRDKQRRQTEGERRLEALWVESVRPYQERQEADHRAAALSEERTTREAEGAA
jgi:hypothetical protein